MYYLLCRQAQESPRFVGNGRTGFGVVGVTKDDKSMPYPTPAVPLRPPTYRALRKACRVRCLPPPAGYDELTVSPLASVHVQSMMLMLKAGKAPVSIVLCCCAAVFSVVSFSHLLFLTVPSSSCTLMCPEFHRSGPGLLAGRHPRAARCVRRQDRGVLQRLL